LETKRKCELLEHTLLALAEENLKLETMISRGFQDGQSSTPTPYTLSEDGGIETDPENNQSDLDSERNQFDRSIDNG
jgi:hypothetical protein